jgi:hypothetical protein
MRTHAYTDLHRPCKPIYKPSQLGFCKSAEQLQTPLCNYESRAKNKIQDAYLLDPTGSFVWPSRSEQGAGCVCAYQWATQDCFRMSYLVWWSCIIGTVPLDGA